VTCCCQLKSRFPCLKYQADLAASLCKAGKVCGEVTRARGRPSSPSPVPAATPSRKRKAASVPNSTRDVQLDQVGHSQSFKINNSVVGNAKPVTYM